MTKKVVHTKRLGTHVHADLVRETLSDGSHAFNIEIREEWDSAGITKIELPCYNEKAAKSLLHSLTENVARQLKGVHMHSYLLYLAYGVEGIPATLPLHTKEDFSDDATAREKLMAKAFDYLKDSYFISVKISKAFNGKEEAVL